jgi:hypothetical protein
MLFSSETLFSSFFSRMATFLSLLIGDLIKEEEAGEEEEGEEEEGEEEEKKDMPSEPRRKEEEEEEGVLILLGIVEKDNLGTEQ